MERPWWILSIHVRLIDTRAAESKRINARWFGGASTDCSARAAYHFRFDSLRFFIFADDWWNTYRHERVDQLVKCAVRRWRIMNANAQEWSTVTAFEQLMATMCVWVAQFSLSLSLCFVVFEIYCIFPIELIDSVLSFFIDIKSTDLLGSVMAFGY